jgi:hypothetical protein
MMNLSNPFSFGFYFDPTILLLLFSKKGAVITRVGGARAGFHSFNPEPAATATIDLPSPLAPG